MIHLPFNTGLSVGLNRALARVETPFAMRMDDDELLTPYSKVGRQLDFLLQHPEVDLANILPYTPLKNRSPYDGAASIFKHDLRYAPNPC